MAGIEKKLAAGLAAVTLLTRTLGCSPPENIPQTPTATAQPTPERLPSATATETPLLSEKKKKSFQLENLHINSFAGEVLGRGRVYQFDLANTAEKISFMQQTTPDNNFVLNPQQLQFIGQECGINRTPEKFQIVITGDGQPDLYMVQSSSDGNTIKIAVDLDNIKLYAGQELNDEFEVSEENWIQSLAILTTLDLNLELFEVICVTATRSDLYGKGASDEIVRSELNTIQSQAKDYRDGIFSGKFQPVIVIKPPSQTL